MSDLRLAQRHCALAIVSALDDDRAGCHRHIVEAARAADVAIRFHGPRKVAEWDRGECVQSLYDGFDSIRYAERWQDKPVRYDFLPVAEACLVAAAELAWPGPDAVPVAPKDEPEVRRGA